MLRLLIFKPFVRSYSIPKRNKLPPRPKWLIKEEEIQEEFLKGGRGPGGQKINKSNSKVQLKHLPTGLIVTCQYSRSQGQNRKRAREILAEKIDYLQNGEQSRVAVVNDRKVKTKQSKQKKANRKYKKVEEDKRLEENQDEHVDLIDIESEIDQMVK